MISKGDAVVIRGSNAIGITAHVDRAQGLAWVIWPDRCGLSECQPADSLQIICERSAVVEALQVIAPVQQLSNPLERAFLNSARSSASTEIIEVDTASRLTPYYAPKAPRR